MKVLSLLFFLCAILPAHASVIRVGAGESVRSIRDAIQLAVPGDTIEVQPGTYREGNLTIEKSISIIGVGRPVLDGENKYEIITLHASGVLIRGFVFRNTGVASITDIAAIKVLDSRDVRIVDNQFENTFFGIYLSNTSHSRIEGNQVLSKIDAGRQIGNGIHLWKCNNIAVNRNTVRGHRDGIYFEFVTESVIRGNTTEGNLRYGLHFMFSHNCEYRDNTFVDNGAGVAVMYTKGVKMIGNTFRHNWGSASYGLLLKDIRDSYVQGNVFLENSVGIFMEGSSRIDLRQNSFERNGYAVRLQASCDDNVFTNNNFKSNTFDVVTNGTLVLNTINNNYWDKYEGYDLDHDQVGDVPFRPVSLYGVIVERIPTAVLLWRSFLVYMLDRAEKAIPAITPENLKDDFPLMKPYDLVQ